MGTEIHDTIYDQYEIKQIVNWLYSKIHNIQRMETPIFDKMMEKRNNLKKSLSLNDDNNDNIKEFIELKKSVDEKLKNEDNPSWHQYDDNMEQEFVLNFLNNKGFEQHSEKFNSMSCLAKLKNAQLRKFEMCAKHRKI